MTIQLFPEYSPICTLSTCTKHELSKIQSFNQIKKWNNSEGQIIIATRTHLEEFVNFQSKLNILMEIYMPNFFADDVLMAINTS